jgi:RNA polymerase sigma-B factor
MVAGASLRPDSLDAVDSHSDAAPLGETLPSGEDPLARLEELICLNQAIHELTAEDQELLYRRYFCEESQAELGRRFGVSQMQVSRRLSRVLVQLQRLLQGCDTGGCDTGDCDTRDKELAAGRALEGGVQSSPSRRRAAITS